MSRPVGTGEWVDLSQPMYEEMPRALPESEVCFTPQYIQTGPPESAVRITHLTLSTHVGTHVDAALHFLPGGRAIEEYPVDAFVGPGVVIDARRDGVVPVTRAEIEAMDPDVREGDIVFFCFGYGRRFGTPAYRDHPYLGDDTAGWLVERGVKLIGVDTTTPDLGGAHRPRDYAYPVHMTLLPRDILIIEHLGPRLEELIGRRVEVNAVPLPIRGGDGAPAPVIARAVSDVVPSEENR
jgi:arylformamidase